MHALPNGFEGCDRETAHGDAAAPRLLPHLLRREGLFMAKRTRWTVCTVDRGGLDSTAAVFDAIWHIFTGAGMYTLFVCTAAYRGLAQGIDTTVTRHRWGLPVAIPVDTPA